MPGNYRTLKQKLTTKPAGPLDKVLRDGWHLSDSGVRLRFIFEDWFARDGKARVISATFLSPALKSGAKSSEEKASTKRGSMNGVR